MGNFRRLVVYEKAVRLADEVRQDVIRWPSFDRWTVGAQLMRAVDSIAANIAEGQGRYGPGDERRFLVIARGSAYETEHWMDRALARGLLTSDTFPERASELSRILNAMIARHS